MLAAAVAAKNMSQTHTTPSGRAGLANCGPRRLPVYFLLDFSSSPAPGFAAEAVRQVRNVTSKLELWAAQTPEDFSRAPVFYAVLVFRGAALQLQPLAPPGSYLLDDLRLDEIEPQGEPGFGAALAALQNSTEHELKMPGADNGDYQPLVFLFTDGLPVEKWQIPPVAKLFLCGIQPAPIIIPTRAGPAPDFLPLHCQAQILEQIELARRQLKLRQQMIDYPTSY
jgi:hypothetical protein